MHTPDDLAAELSVPRAWVMKHLSELPHMRVGKHIRFTAKHWAEILASFERRPRLQTDETPGLTKRSRSHRRKST